MSYLTIYLDGNFQRFLKEDLDQLAPGVLKGRGIFETMRSCDGRVVDFFDHLQRMQRGLRSYKFSIPWVESDLLRLIGELLSVNGLKNARIRLSVWEEKKTLRKSIICQPQGGPSKEKYQTGFHVMIAKRIRNRTRFSHIKSMDYRIFRESYLEAKRLGFDEALLLNKDKHLVEGTRTNIFFIKENILCTPSVHCGCLNGITRQKIIRCAKAIGLRCQWGKFSFRKLKRAQEAFLTNSLWGVMPLTEIEGKRIGDRGVGKITMKLSLEYSRLIKGV